MIDQIATGPTTPTLAGNWSMLKNWHWLWARWATSVDIITRRIARPRLASVRRFPLDGYPGYPNVRILRILCGPHRFPPKEKLWPHLGPDWVTGILDFYRSEGALPRCLHRPLCRRRSGKRPSSGERLGAPLHLHRSLAGRAKDGQARSPPPGNLADLDARYHFARRIAAERVSNAPCGCDRHQHPSGENRAIQPPGLSGRGGCERRRPLRRDSSPASTGASFFPYSIPPADTARPTPHRKGSSPAISIRRPAQPAPGRLLQPPGPQEESPGPGACLCPERAAAGRPPTWPWSRGVLDDPPCANGTS